MDMILLTYISLGMTVFSYIIVSILKYFGLMYHLEYDMIGLNYLILAKNSPDSMDFPYIVLFY